MVHDDHDNQDDHPEITDEELRLRVLYSLFLPAVRLARVFRMPIRELTGWLEVAYFHEAQRAGLTQTETAELFGVSRRTVAELSRRLKANFFAPERHEGLPRRIEFMLWAGPMTEGRIRQALPEVDDAEIDAALARLVDDERVLLVEGRTPTYEVPRSSFRLYKNEWLARIDGLNNHLHNVATTVFSRFFRGSDGAFSRTLNFRVRPEDMAELERLYQETIFPRLAELDAAAKGDDDARTLDLSIHWAPSDALDSLNPKADTEDS